MELGMVDKLIRGKIIEIVIVTILVTLTIPIWQSFSERMSKADIMSLEDYNLAFSVSNNNNRDIVSISNDYYINKSYKLIMKVSKEIDIATSKVIINNISYNLEEFAKRENGGYYFYTLAANHISGKVDSYEIEPKLMGKSSYYAYVFEESNNF